MFAAVGRAVGQVLPPRARREELEAPAAHRRAQGAGGCAGAGPEG